MFLYTFPKHFPWRGPMTVYMSYMCFLFFMTHTYGTRKDLSFILALSNESTCTFPAEMWVGTFVFNLAGEASRRPSAGSMTYSSEGTSHFSSSREQSAQFLWIY